MWASAAAATLLTLAVALDDELSFAYRQLELRVALETAVALVGVVLGAFFVVRFRSSRSLSDFGVGAAVLVFSFSNLLYGVIPRLVGGTDQLRFAVWAPLAARTIGALVLAVSPFVDRRIGRRHAIGMAVGLSLAIVSIGALLAITSSNLPDGVVIDEPLSEASRPHVSTDPLIIAAQCVAAVLFAVAAVGFTRRAAERGDDHLVKWLAAGAVWLAASRVHFVLFPSIYSDWLYTGDLLRLVGYVAWLVGALLEIARAGSERQQLAVLQERRRIARELHDGLAQDLSFIHSQAAASTVPTTEVMEQLATSAQRALREARLAVEALADDEMPPEVALRRAAELIAVPSGLEVTCSFQPGARLAPDVRHELARIVREATSNAVRHSGASSIALELDVDAAGDLWLMIGDDGDGFDVDGATGGFGLTSMRERAERLGGRLTVTSRPGEGTIVEIHLAGGRS